MITAVWGRADGHNVVFQPSQRGDWWVSVPPDLTDGQYAVEIWAENDAGEQSYWTGTLYMVDSVLVCLHLADDPYMVRLLPERYEAYLMDDRYAAGLSRRQCHV